MIDFVYNLLKILPLYIKMYTQGIKFKQFQLWPGMKFVYRSVYVMRKPIQVSIETKQRLENINSVLGSKKLSDTIDIILDRDEDFQKQITDLNSEMEAFKNHVKENYIELDNEARIILNSISEELHLSLNDTVAFLQDVYMTTKTIDKHVFDKWMYKRSS